MNTSLTRPCMALKRTRVRMPRRVIQDLKEISKLSSFKQWEYAGGIKYTNSEFGKPTRVTSEKRSRVDVDDISGVWYSKIAYHTHPGIGYNEETVCENTPIYTTLPSNADFEAYVKGFPEMQVNILCDSHGYYVIDIMKSAYNMASPLPISINEHMRKIRSQPFMRISAFSDDGLEYFHTTTKNWKRWINEEVSKELNLLYGISIRYYTYHEDPPIVTLYEDIDVV